MKHSNCRAPSAVLCLQSNDSCRLRRQGRHRCAAAFHQDDCFRSCLSFYSSFALFVYRLSCCVDFSKLTFPCLFRLMLIYARFLHNIVFLLLFPFFPGCHLGGICSSSNIILIPGKDTLRVYGLRWRNLIKNNNPASSGQRQPRTIRTKQQMAAPPGPECNRNHLIIFFCLCFFSFSSHTLNSDHAERN